MFLILLASKLYFYIPFGILGGALVILFSLLIYRFFSKRRRIDGSEIEKRIDPKTNVLKIKKLIRKSIIKEKYQHAIIYQFYLFRIFCQDKQGIRNARTLKVERLLELIRGNPIINYQDVLKAAEIYKEAILGIREMEKVEYQKISFLLERFTDP